MLLRPNCRRSPCMAVALLTMLISAPIFCQISPPSRHEGYLKPGQTQRILAPHRQGPWLRGLIFSESQAIQLKIERLDKTIDVASPQANDFRLTPFILRMPEEGPVTLVLTMQSQTEARNFYLLYLDAASDNPRMRELERVDKIIRKQDVPASDLANTLDQLQKPQRTPPNDPDIWGEGLTHIYAAHLSEAIENPEKAFLFWTQAGRAFSGTGNLNLVLACNDRRAKYLTAMGRGDDARLILLSSLVRKDQTAQVLRARLLQDIGEIETLSGYFADAIHHLSEAIQIRLELAMKYRAGLALHALGNAHTIVGELQEAKTAYQRAITLFDQHPIEKYSTRAELGWLAFRQKNYAEAVKILEEVIAYAEANGQQSRLFGALDRIGSVQAARGNFQVSEKAYRRALALIPEKHPSKSLFQALIHTNMAELSHLSGRFDTGLAFCRQALDAYPRDKSLEGRASVYWTQAKIFRDQGHLARSRSSFLQCLADIETLKTRSGSGQTSYAIFQAAFEFVEDTFHLWWDCHINEPDAGFDSEAFSLLERVRANGLLDRLAATPSEPLQRNTRHGKSAADLAKIRDIALNQTSELFLEKSPPKEPEKKSSTYSLQELRESFIDAETILLTYLLGEKQSYLWLVSQERVAYQKLPPRALLEKQINAFLHTIQDTMAHGQRQILGRKISRQLLGVLTFEERRRRLVIVPDGMLYNLPFSALPSPHADAVTKPALIQDHELIFLPSAATLPAIRQRASNRKTRPDKFAVFADPVFQSNDQRFISPDPSAQPAASKMRGVPGLSRTTFYRLSSSREEYDAIAGFVDNKEYFDGFTGFQATRANLFTLSKRQYRVLHLATHGFYLSEQPDLSGLVLSLFDRNGEPLNGYLSTRDIGRLRLDAELVVLSACQTARGRFYRGEGVVGLCRAFLEAGADSVVASLWDADDKATALLMSYFYEAMAKDTLGPGAALQQAQQKMGRHPHYHHPRYWAGFSLIGDWRQKIF